MIDYLIYIPACFAINMAFGPNNLLALTHGAQVNLGFALAASLGRLLAFIPMIAVSALGLGIILSASTIFFTLIKIAGAGYLIWLGIKLWRTSFDMESASLAKQTVSLTTAFKREALIALGNPKAILVFAAFLPQFIDPENYVQTYSIVGGLFVVLEVGAIAIYAAIGQFAARRATQKMHLFQRASGGGMIVFGALLLLVKAPNTS
jgi:threonine/homoserine/homoserine lactone efflux protein